MSKPEPKYTNSLAHESSPYLQQHAHNPVDWHPWGEAAFEKARTEGKIVFLSIGYATCHWCHVMEHECFEDEEVAEMLNASYVSIKVDREERPDIDEIYMSASRYLGGGGGWPLTVILTPDKEPFYAATYIPKNSNYGQEGILTLMPRISEVYKADQPTIRRVVTDVKQRVNNATSFGSLKLEEDINLNSIMDEMLQGFDIDEGGQLSRQKFPQSHQLLYLLAHSKRTGRKDVLDMVKLTVEKIRAGGIYDQIGFGIHRYAVDTIWHVPHFEKMLYNQAQYSMALMGLYLQTSDERYCTWANEIYTYVLRDLTHAKGGFFSAEDADSEGEEGLFYVWFYNEVEELLSEDEFDAFIRYFELKTNGNWIEHPSGEAMPTNVLRVVTEPGKHMPWIESSDVALIESAREKLLNIRAQRVRPLRDEKILTDWNALMIASLAKAARVSNDEKLAEAAIKSYGFIKKNLWLKDRLFHRWKDGNVGVDAFLEDYTYLAWGALELYNATLELKYLNDAIALMRHVYANFRANDGGYFMTSADEINLFNRPMVLFDNALPSGNGVAFYVFSELAYLTGDMFYIAESASMAKSYSMALSQGPSSFSIAGRTLERRVSHPTQVVIILPKDKLSFGDWLAKIYQLPGNVTILLKTPKNGTALAEIAPFTEKMVALNNKITVYVCDGFTCKEPITDLEML